MSDFNARIQSIAHNLGLFLLPSQTVQLSARNLGSARMVKRFFRGSELDDMAAQALRWEGEGAHTLYFTLNPLREDAADSRRFANDGDVTCRRFLMVDSEASGHANGLSATEEERAAAWTVLQRARGIMESAGFQGEIILDSGNGWHADYPIDLLNDDEAKNAVKSLLKGLAARCDDDQAHIDTDTYKALQHEKVYGCLNRKGEPTAERPFRYTQVISGKFSGLEVAAANTARLTRLLGLWQAEEDRAKGVKRTPLAAAAKDAARLNLYAQAALDREAAAVAGAKPGSRNRQLNESAFAVGQLVGAGAIPRDLADGRLSSAARSCGLDDAEIRGTLRSGLEAGIAQPRQLPESNGYHTPVASNGQAQTPAPAEPAAVAVPAQPAEQQWEPPIPLDAPPAAAPFPLDVLPGSLRRYVEECAWATNTPVDFTAVPMLAMAGGAIGNSRRLAIKEDHHQSACLNAGIVGSPGTGKSIPLDFLSRPFEKAERKCYTDWKIACQNWEEADPKSRGAKPSLERRIIDDITGESLVRVLGQNPRGVTMIRDELAALITGMNQYKEGGKGSDRQVYLKLWNHATICVDRNKQEGVPIKVYRPFCPIVGAIQPDVVQTMRNEAMQGKKVMDDGLTDRFLFCYPDVPPAQGERWRAISFAAKESWEDAVSTMLSFRMEACEEGGTRPHLVFLTNDGKEAWVMETDRHAAEINSHDFLEWLRGPWAKFVGYAGRLSLIIQLLRFATGEASGENVDGDSMERAWKLVDYFKAHTQKLLVLMGGDPRVADARKVLNWISAHPGKPVFSRSDVYVDLRRSFATPESLEAPLKLLAEHRFVQRLPEPTRSGEAGRRPTPKYMVNPLGTSQNPNNPNNVG